MLHQSWFSLNVFLQRLDGVVGPSKRHHGKGD
jgi:hypothetical protein